MTPEKCAVWLRVSHVDGSQDTAAQRAALEAEASRRGLEVVRTFDVSGSAWSPGRVQAAVSELVRGVPREYEVVLVWALDRLTREGIEATLRAVNRISIAGGQLVSLQEPWVEQSGEARELLAAIFGWGAQFESRRRSERTKAGLERRRARGLPVGRQPGAKDKKKRRRSGYVARYERS